MVVDYPFQPRGASYPHPPRLKAHSMYNSDTGDMRHCATQPAVAACQEQGQSQRFITSDVLHHVRVPYVNYMLCCHCNTHSQTTVTASFDLKLHDNCPPVLASCVTLIETRMGKQDQFSVNIVLLKGSDSVHSFLCTAICCHQIRKRLLQECHCISLAIAHFPSFPGTNQTTLTAVCHVLAVEMQSGLSNKI